MEKSIGPINSIVLARAGESDKIYKKDQNSINENGLCELMISENQFMNFNDRVDYLQELSDKLFGVEYYLNDFVSTGIMYYDLLDMYNIEIFGKTYNCLMLNDEQDITQGLEENIHTDRPETSETDYKKADTTDRKINQTYLIVDKQNQKIEGVINQIGDRTDKTTTITADIDGLNSKVSTIADLTNETSGTQIVTLENCVEGEVVELHIYGNNTVFKYQYLSDDLYLSDNLLLGKDKSIIIITDANGNKTYFDLGIEEVLRQHGDTRDEYILKDGQAQIIRRINKDGTIKDNETTEDLGEFHILLPKGNNTLEIKDFSASIYVKWAVQNEYTDIFATKAEMNSNIEQSSQQITLSVDKKLENYSTTTEMNSAITVKANEITSNISQTYETKENASKQYSNIKQATDSISSEVGKKVGNDEVISKINQSAEAVTILASKLGLTAEDVLNLISNNVLNLTTKNLVIQSTYFNVTKDGKVKITGNRNLIIGDTKSNYVALDPGEISLWDTSGGNLSIMPNALVMMSNYNSSSMTPDEISAPKITQTSLEEKKKNFEKMKDNALEIINGIDIYRYNLKTENDKDKKHIGFVIGDKYNYSKEVTSLDNTGVDTYSFVSLCCKAIQEQQEQIEELKKEIEKLKGEKNG